MSKSRPTVPFGPMGTEGGYLFLINSLGAGGAEHSLMELLGEARRRKIRTVVLIFDRDRVGFDDEARESGFDVRLIRSSTWVGRIREVRRTLLDWRPSLIYTTLFEADLVGRLSALGTGVCVVGGLVNTTYDPVRLGDTAVRKWRLHAVRFVDGWTARRLCTHFHAISDAVKASAVSYLRIPPDRITVVRRGRNLSRLGEPSEIRWREVRRKENLPQDAFVFITVGRQEYQKGHVVLIGAFAQLAASQPSALLLIAGRDGHASAQTKALIDRLDLGDRVRLLGHRRDVAELLAGSDVFVFPSLYEGLGGAAIEAMALGLPMIVSDLPALNELIDEEGSVRVPPGNVLALAEAMRAMVSSDNRPRMGHHNRERFLAHFQSTVANRRLLDLLETTARNYRT